MIRVGIVGAGWMASERAASFAGMDGVSVAGICSRDIEKARVIAGRLDAKSYADFPTMLAECDAVVICAPNSAHAGLAKAALTAGRHVLVEYPLCTTMEDTAKLRQSSVQAGRVLMVGNTIIHEAMFKYLAKTKTKLGRLLSASSRVAFYSDEMAGRWYMDEKATGCVFSAMHYHHIEYYKHILGDVEWVLGREQRIPDEKRPGYASTVGGALTLGHSGGGVSSLQWYLTSTGDGATPRGLWITGTKSSVTVVSVDGSHSQAIWDGGGEGNTETYEDDWGVDGSCRDFVDAIDGRLDHAAQLESDIITLKIGIYAGKSSTCGEIVRLEDTLC